MNFTRPLLFLLSALALLPAPAVAAPSQAGVVLIRQANLMPDGAPAPIAGRSDGKVTLWVYAAAGSPAREVRLGTGSGFAALDQAAIRAIRRWRSIPLLDRSGPEAQWLVVELVYDARPTLTARR